MSASPSDPNSLSLKETSSTPPVSYGTHAARGMAWVASSVIIGKAAALVAQIVLGWLLSKGDFGLYALAISTSAIAVNFRDGGSRKILLQRGHEYATLAGPIFQVALAFNLVITMLLVVASPFLAQLYDAPRLAPLLWVVAASLLLDTPTTVLNAKLSHDLRFREISNIASISAVLRQFSTVAFALLGFGPMSFVLPMLVSSVFDLLATLRLAGWFQMPARIDWPLFRQLLATTQLLMVGTIAKTLAFQGDYLTIGKLETKEILGIYFFAYQLTVSISALFHGGFLSVLMPSLTRLNNEPRRQAQAYLKTVRALGLVMAPLCVIIALTAQPLLHGIWNGKWDKAVPVVQLLALSLPIRMLPAVSIALLEAHGRWRLWSGVWLLDGIGNILAAAIGAWMGGLIWIAIWITGYRVFIGVFQIFVVRRVIPISRRDFLVSTLATSLLATFLGAIIFALHNQWEGLPPLISVTFVSLSFLVAYLGAIWFCMRGALSEFLSVLRRG